MFEFVNDNTLAEYEAFNMSHPFGHFAQSKKWANLKDNWKWEAVIVRDERRNLRFSRRAHPQPAAYAVDADVRLPRSGLRSA